MGLFVASSASAERFRGAVGIKADDELSRGMGFEFIDLRLDTVTDGRFDLDF